LNRERILMVADAMEKGTIKDLGFNMAAWIADPANLWGGIDHSGRDCGTTCCGAGWTLHVALNAVEPATSEYWLIMKAKALMEIESDTVFELARRWLGISSFSAERLFTYSPMGVPLSSVSLETAVLVWRNFADTGLVNWNI
jgi:hypothetical protein